MKDYPDLTEDRRKTLAKIRIISGEMSDKDVIARLQTYKPANDQQMGNKQSFGMMLVGVMLTLTSIVLVSLCFVTTVHSFDLALNSTDHMGQRGHPSRVIPAKAGTHY